MTTLGLRDLSRAAMFVLLLAAAGCSHMTPYYRSDVTPLANVTAADAEVLHRVLLVGDAGDTEADSSVFASLGRWAGQMPERTLIIFLGDNIYPAGMPEEGHPDRKDAEQRLSPQLAAIKESGPRGLFLSGNHDWGDDRQGGLRAVRRQEEYVNAALGGEGNFLPRGGSAGPVKLDFNGVRIIVLNTAWWLHEEGAAAASDPAREKDLMVEGLQRLLAGADGRDVLVAAHHPLASHGTQGGFYDWKDHIFPSTHLARGLSIPTPILGSLYPLLRSLVYNKQTLAGTEYKEMRKRLTAALSTNRPLVYAAGHDHGLQVLAGGAAAEYMLVSALGLDVGASLGHGDETLFAHLHPGFMAVDFMAGGKVLLRVIEPGDDGVVFSKWIKGGG